METYTELTEVETESTFIDSAETEEIETLNEGVFLFENQRVLDSLNENKQGQLTYKNKAVAFERNAISFEMPYDDGNNFYITTDGNGLYALSDYTETLRDGAEIASIEMWVDNPDGARWVDFRDMALYDGRPFVLNMYKVRSSYSQFSGETVLCTIYCPQNTPFLLDALVEGTISKLKITVYTEAGDTNG